MSLAKVLVLFLRLVSLGGVLFVISLASAVFLIPEEIPPEAQGLFSPGCLGVVILVMLLPFSLIPAFVAWIVQERAVRPREMAEESWRNEAPLREERLGSWMRYVVELALRRRRSLALQKDSMPVPLDADIARALREMDHGRRRRFLRFLHEIEWQSPGEELALDGLPGSGPEPFVPRRGLTSLATSLLALASGFFFLWACLMTMSIILVDPLKTLGVGYSRLAQIVLGAGDALILSLILGLAAVGLRRMYRQAEQSLEARGGDQEVIQGTALKHVREQLEILARWEATESSEIKLFAGKVAHALLAATVPELGGVGRAKLIRLLYEADWLEGRLSLAGVELRGVELAGASLPGVCLAGADLSGSDLSNADLSLADLSRCVLCGSDLRSARLVGANLHGADLRYTRLQKAGLEGADLKDVLLEGANFWGAALSGAELSGAKGSAENLVAVS